MLGDCTIRINRAQNGYTISMTDPKIVAENDKSKGPWKDPNVTFICDDIDKGLQFIKENLDKAFPENEFDSTFDKAAKDLK